MRLVSLAFVVLLGYGVAREDGCVGRVSTSATDNCVVSVGSSRPDVALGHEFTLAPGDSVVVGSGGLRVSFERVVEDSRCPTGTTCIWAGQVVIEVRAGTSGGARYELRPEESVTAGGYRVRLLRVEPYPSAASPIRPSDYRATLIVDCQ